MIRRAYTERRFNLGCSRQSTLLAAHEVSEHYKDKEQNCYVSEFNELISVELEK